MQDQFNAFNADNANEGNSAAFATETSAQLPTTITSPESKVITLPQADFDSNSTPRTFSDSLVKIGLSKGKHRESLYRLIGDTYTACRLGFSGNTPDERADNMTVLDATCAEQGITGQTYYQKLGKLAFGDDSKQVSSIIHVIKVAEKNEVAPFNFIAWLVKEGGIQAVRSKYRSDGTLKPAKQEDTSPKKSSGSNKDGDSDNETYISKGKTALNARVEATIPKGQLGIIEKIGNEAECTAILRQAADGSFVVKAVLADQKLVDSLYAAYGRSIPENQA